MATPSLKKMEGGTQEGIYASSNASHVGEVDQTDLGLTLLPGSQIQTECEKKGHVKPDKVHHEGEFLRELNNGSNERIASNSGENALHGKVHQVVCSQKTTGDPVDIEPEGITVCKHHETTCAPDSSGIKTADRSGDRVRVEPCKASMVSKEPARSISRDRNDLNVSAYPVNVRVSEGSSSAVRGVDRNREREPVHGLIRSVEGEIVVLDDEATSSESDAEGSPDRLRLYKRQKTEEYLPCSLFHDRQDALVEQLDLGVDLWTRGLSDDEVVVLSIEASGALRSRSHSRRSNVLRVSRGTGSEPHYPPPRLTSTLALETRSRSLSTPGSSGISSGHTISHSACPERFHGPLSNPPQTSRAITAPVLSTMKRTTSRQPHEPPNSTAPSASMADLSDTPQTGDSFTTHAQPESVLNEGSCLLERLPSATPLPSHDVLDRNTFPTSSVTISSLSLPTYQSNSAESLHTVSLSTISPAQSPFTERFDKGNNNSIHGNMGLAKTADYITTQGDDLLLKTALPYRIGPLPSQEAYESPYAPKSRRLQRLLGSQTRQRNITTNRGYRDPMENSTLEPATTATAATPPKSQHPHPAMPIQSNTPSPRPISQLRPAIQSEPGISMPPPPAPSTYSISRTGSPIRASSEQDSAESDKTSSDSSSEDSSPAPTEKILMPPALVNTAKKGLHAITSVIVNRIHHADIVPRVISFIKTFPPSSDPSASPNDSLAGPRDACPADHMDLLYKNDSLSKRNQDLLQRNKVLERERDRFRRAAREWATMDPESGLTKGQSMSREVRSLRSQLAKKTAEAERLRNAWFDLEASRSTSHQWNDTSPMLPGAPPGHANSNGRELRVDMIWQDTGAFSSGYENRSFPIAEPTPPASKRVSIDLTEGTPEPSLTLATPQPARPRPLSSSPAAAELRSIMKRKAYSWLPDKSNHMAKKPSPASRGSRPSTAIELDVEGAVIDAEAELEAELERELLASQHAEERERRERRERQRNRQRQQAAAQRRQKMTPQQKATKDQRAKAATTAMRTGRVEEERERLVVVEEQRWQQQQQRVEDEQRLRAVGERARDEELFRVEDEQRLRVVEERARDEELFMVEDDQQRKEAEERARDEELFGIDEEEPEEMVDVQVGPEGGWDEAAELDLRRALDESCEESEEE